MKTTIKVLFVFVIILIFSSCFSDWKGEATLTISFGGSNGRAAAWIPENGVVSEVMEKITHKITLSNGTDEIPLTVVGKGSVTETVAPGSWTVKIDALYDEDLPFATGTWEANVIAGRNNEVEVEMKPSDYTFFAVDSFDEWGNAVESINKEPAGKTCVIIITKDFSTSPLTLSASGEIIRGDIIICGNHTITLTGTGCLLNIWGNRKVTLRDVKLQGNGSPNNLPLVTVEGNGANFTMEGNASVTGNTNRGDNGGGVAVYGGTFNMSGSAVISGNILTEKKDENENVLGGNGGGVYVDGGTFNMSGNAVISENTVAVNVQYKGYGGGVYIENGTFTMSGSAVISGNTAILNGGGVAVYAGTFTMKESATVSDNEAGEEGGGVHVTDNSKFYMWNNASVSDNSCNDGYDNGNGGGVYVTGGITYGSIFYMYGGFISRNKAGAGGGVVVGNGSVTDSLPISEFNMEGGTVSDNIAYKDGGGVHISSNGIFNMSGGTVSSNITTGDGGGVYVYGNPKSEFNMTGGTVSGNSAEYNGGGVFVTNGGKFTMTDGTISGNAATNNGGGVYVEGANSCFYIVTGTVYGSNGSSLSNNASSGAALYKYGNNTIAKRGTYTGSTWNNAEDLNTTPDTINVRDGQIVP